MDKELKCKEKPETAGKKSAQSSPVVAPKKPHATAFKTQSLESGMFSGMGRMKVSLEPPRELVAAGSRPRSASDGDQKKMHYSSKDDNHHNLVISRSHSRAASFGNEAENRNVAFHITDHSVTIVGLVSKVVLMEKRLKDISFCQQVSFSTVGFLTLPLLSSKSTFSHHLTKAQWLSLERCWVVMLQWFGGYCLVCLSYYFVNQCYKILRELPCDPTYLLFFFFLQGSENSDHFGFICHEGKTSQFVCYIFKGQSVQMVGFLK